MSARSRFSKNWARLVALLAGGALPSLLAVLLGIYLVRALTSHRRPRPVPHQLLASGGRPVQLPSAGHGVLFHRRYRLLIDRPRLHGRKLMDHLKANLPEFSPKLLAAFEKSRGHPRVMRPGDEYKIGILGPWNGEVRVAEVTPTSFTFVTLEGHPEAGQITFALAPAPAHPGAISFEINSWARSRDMLVSLSYNEGKIGKEVQKNVWITFCERVAEASGGTPIGEVEVTTDELGNAGEVVPVA